MSAPNSPFFNLNHISLQLSTNFQNLCLLSLRTLRKNKVNFNAHEKHKFQEMLICLMIYQIQSRIFKYNNHYIEYNDWLIVKHKQITNEWALILCQNILTYLLNEIYFIYCHKKGSRIKKTNIWLIILRAKTYLYKLWTRF